MTGIFITSVLYLILTQDGINVPIKAMDWKTYLSHQTNTQTVISLNT